MSYFCRGTLKIRGKKEDICNFIENGLKYYPDPENVNYCLRFIKYHEDKYLIDYTLYNDVKYTSIDKCPKHFIEDNQIQIHNKGWIWNCFITLLAYWNINTEYLVAISKKYNLDFKIYAFEKDKQFNRDIEIHQGKVIKDEIIEFEDYEWECVCPTI